MKRIFLIVVTFIFALDIYAEDFKWSWDAELDTPPVAEEKTDDEGGLVPVKETEEEKIETPQPAGGEEGLESAYRKLLNDNLELRRKITEAENQAQVIRDENKRLAGEIQDLEKKIGESVKLIQSLKAEQKKPDVMPDKVIELEQKLEKAEKEKTQLLMELEKARAQAITSPLPERVVQSVPVTQDVSSVVKPDSDLFKSVEKENLRLKEKLSTVEAERKKAIEEREKFIKSVAEAKRKAEEEEKKRLEVEKKLEKVSASEKEKSDSLDNLMKRIPEMEKEIADLRQQLKKKEMSSSKKSEDTALLKAELERREQRLAKAEKMLALLEKTRSEVYAYDKREKRDMHYNMAVVYQREGKFKEAEEEYLKALQIDGADADVHYNLGILYEEGLGDVSKALLHYRRYLKLAPDSPDAVQVKEWIMRLEMTR